MGTGTVKATRMVLMDLCAAAGAAINPAARAAVARIKDLVITIALPPRFFLFL
jgi:hypothetical protein